jgi:tRNA modification GTPase
VLAEIEGAIDFPEDDLELDTDADIDRELGELAAACGRLADGFRHGRAVSRGIAVALVGAVNVGKSSLLNALVGRERALVGAAPGTTRDWLEVTDAWSGVAVTLVDTAGLRTTDDPVEQRGIALGEARVASADVVVVVNDGVAAWDDGARFGARAVVIRSKADLGGEPGEWLLTSAATGQGLEELRCRVLAVAGVADQEGSEQAFVRPGRRFDVDGGGRVRLGQRAARFRVGRRRT